MMPLTPGDRVATPAGSFGIVLEQPWSMPKHELIQLDDGTTLWILRHLLQPAIDAEPSTKRKRRAAK